MNIFSNIVEKARKIREKICGKKIYTALAAGVTVIAISIIVVAIGGM